jgi:hypothetical protein
VSERTVLLNETERLAVAAGYRTISVESHEDKSLAALLVPQLRKVLFEIDRLAGAGDKVRRGLRVLGSFIGALKMSVDDLTFGLDIDPERGAADSGDLVLDLPSLFVAIGDAAEERKAAVALFIDEIQYLDRKELGALIMAMHKIQQRQLPIVLIAAGLPVLPALAGESKSYAERLFSFPAVGALSKEDAMRALQEPAHEVGVAFEPNALHEVIASRAGIRTSCRSGVTKRGIMLTRVRSPCVSSKKLQRPSPCGSTRTSSKFATTGLLPASAGSCVRWRNWVPVRSERATSRKSSK